MSAYYSIHLTAPLSVSLAATWVQVFSSTPLHSINVAVLDFIAFHVCRNTIDKMRLEAK